MVSLAVDKCSYHHPQAYHNLYAKLSAIQAKTTPMSCPHLGVAVELLEYVIDLVLESTA